MVWVVAKFVESEEVEVLPKKWLFDDNSKSYYPPYGRTKLERAIKAQENPSSEWKSFSIILMSQKLFDSFAIAISKVTKACFTSDISDIEQLNELPPTRERKKRTFSSSEESDEASLDNFPTFNKNKGT